MLLAGKTALVTGASRGLGKEIIRQMLLEGAKVILTSRSDVRQAYNEFAEFTAKDKLGYVIADLSWEYGINALVSATGDVDILVNNAASEGAVMPLADYDMGLWQDVITVNLLAPVSLCHRFVPRMKEKGWGKIINISGGGAFNPRPNYSAYATSKAALVRFSETLAAELKAFHVDVNCVSPGAMGPMGYPAAVDGRNRQAEVNAARLVVALASPESDGLTGRTISAVFDDWPRVLKEKVKVIGDPDIYTLRREIGWQE